MGSPPSTALEQLRVENQRLRARIATLEARSDQAPLTAPYGPPIWFDAVSDAIFVTDAERQIQHWNRAAEQIYGWSCAEVLGRSITEIIPAVRYLDDDAATVMHHLRQEGVWRGVVVQHARDGRELIMESATQALNDDQGALCGYIGVNRDVTTRVEAQQAAQRAAARLQVLADASHAFAEAGADTQVVLEQIARIIADALVAGCVIRLRADDGPWFDTVTVYDRDPARQTVVADHVLRTRISLDGPNPVAVVARSGQALLMPRIDLEAVRATVAPALWSALALVQAHSGMIAPLRAHGQILGVLSFARYAPAQPAFSQDDLTLAQELADRAALAIHNARLYQDVQAAQQAAAEALARLDALITSTPTGIGYLDRDLRYQLVNPALALINGRAPADHLGRTPADLIPGLAPRLEPIIRQVLATGAAVRDLQLHGKPRPRGEVARDWLISYFPVSGPAGATVGIGVTVTDITKSKQVERALQASAAKLLAAMDSMTDAVCILDSDGHFVELNEAFASFHRFPNKAACAKTLAAYPALLDIFLPTGVLVPLEQWPVPRALRGETATSAEYTLHRKDTGETWAGSYSFAPMRDPGGAIVGAVVVGRDISQRKAAEAQIQAALAAEQVARLAAEVASTRMARLQAITADLAGALTWERVLAVITGYSIIETTAADVVVALLEPGGQQLRCVSWSGRSAEELVALPSLLLSAPRPMSAAVRHHVSIWLGSRDEAEARFPGFGAVMAHYGTYAHATLPLFGADHILGAISFSYPAPTVFSPEERAFMQALAQQCAQALDRAQLYNETLEVRGRLHLLSQRLLETQEQERRHIARELHDEIGQALGALKINLHLLGAQPGVGGGTARLDESLTMVDVLIQQVRALSLELRPSVLDDLGLSAALVWYCDRLQQRSGFLVAFADGLGDVPVSPLVATTCFRIAQEALTNVARHAHARRVTVTLSRQEETLALGVCDDGVGFDVRDGRARAVAGASLGLISMAERAEWAGGWMDISSAPGDGTEVWAWLPLDIALAAAV